MTCRTKRPSYTEALLRTLTDIFAPGSAPLAEGLRTLVVSPERFTEPGMTVRATFSFTNIGGGLAKGLRVRFSLPEGLIYLVDSAYIDDRPLDSFAGVGAIVKAGGVEVGDIPPGSERCISVAYVVAATVENDVVIEIQAAISSVDTPAIGSNIVRLIVRSKPDLQSDKTYVTLAAVREPLPGADLLFTARICNTGQSSANDVMLVMPTPIGTTYIFGSAQVDGVPIDDHKRREPFGYGNPVIVASKLASGATLTVQYRATIDTPLPNATPIVMRAFVSSLEVSEFALSEATLLVCASAGFDGEATRLEIRLFDGEAMTEEVQPGQLLILRLIAQNSGNAAAHGVRARIELPQGLLYAGGSLRVDGHAFPEPTDMTEILLDELESQEVREVSLLATVTSPACNGYRLLVAAELFWSNGSRALTSLLSVHAQAHFSPSRTCLIRESPPIIEPGEAVVYQITILNDGTSVADEAMLALHSDERLEGLKVREGAQWCEMKGGKIPLGPLAPQVPRRLTIAGTLCSPLADGTEIRLGATVSANECASFDLNEQITIVRARPRFLSASSFFRLQSGPMVRPDQICLVAVLLRNEGNDRAYDVYAKLQYAPELRLERVEGAVRDGSHIRFGDIESGGSCEATLHLRLIHLVPRGVTVDLNAVIFGRGLQPFVFETMRIETYAEPSFSGGVSLLSFPRDVVDMGAELSYRLSLRNTGDGTAKKIAVKAQRQVAAAYIPGSTSVNGRLLLDRNGESLLWSEQGLVFSEVAPRVEILIEWMSVVGAPLPLDTILRMKATITYDEDGLCEIEAPALVVRSAPLFSATSGDIPCSIEIDPVPALVSDDRQPMPLYQRMRRALALPAEPIVVRDRAALDEVRESLRLVTEFSPERIDRTTRFLAEVGSGSLLTHLFALRALFPGVADGSPHLDMLLEEQRAELRVTLDRLFVKMRLPHVEIIAEDLEARNSRDTTMRLFTCLAEERPIGMMTRRSEVAYCVGTCELRQAGLLASNLDVAPLGGAMSWYALAHLLGESLEFEGSHFPHIGVYRDRLIDELSELVAQPIEAFHRALVCQKSVVLDTALQEMLASFQLCIGVSR